MKVLVTGCNGQLGHDVALRCQAVGMDLIIHDRCKADITDEEAMKGFIKSSKADVVVHCAAYTAVDRAESERDLCYRVNVNGSRYIAEVCAELNIKLVYISTDYVFDGSGDVPWSTSDLPHPINYYGETKYLGELEVMKIVKKYFIVRVSWLFGQYGNNFVKTMIRLANGIDPIAVSERKSIKVVADQIGSPTYTYDLAILICDILKTDQYGVYHAVNEGYCSWYDFACEIFRQKKMKVSIDPIMSSEYKTNALRPHNSKLDCSSLTKSGFKLLPDWKDALSRFLTVYQN